MKVIVNVDNCNECPYFYEDPFGPDDSCLQESLLKPTYYGIPEDCPYRKEEKLEDKEG